MWHVVVPITDDLTSAWLLASTASDAAARPVWWACLLALSAAGLERAWLLATLVATAAVIPLLFCARAALNLTSWCGRLCCTFPAGAVCCLLLLCCCRPCIKFAEEHPRGWCFTAARLFRRLNCTSTSTTAAAATAAPSSGNRNARGYPHAVLFSDALLWAVVGSRARCSRFWEGLGWSLFAGGARQAAGGGVVGGGASLAFGDVIDTWVGVHPFSCLGKAVFGRVRCRRRCCCRRRSRPCCEDGCAFKRRRNVHNDGDDDDGSSGGIGSNSSNSSAGTNNSENGEPEEDRQLSGRRRRANVLVRAVGETLVVDGLSLALSAVSRGGWNGSLTGIAGVSALFSALQLLTEVRYYVTEASEALEPCACRDGDGDDVESSSSSTDNSERWGGDSSSNSEESDGSEDSAGRFEEISNV